RLSDFLTTDGEKPNRNRDAEFEMPAAASFDEVMAWWNASWAVAFQSIESLGPEDLGRTVTIRREELLVLEALNRLASHTAYHVGQLVYLAKHFAGTAWTSLTIPRGQSAKAIGAYKQQ